MTNLTATPGERQIILAWTNPGDADFIGALIRYKTTGFPTSPYDGTSLVVKPNIPGSNDSFVHLSLVRGPTYYYAAFAYDQIANYAAAALVDGMPLPPGDFDDDGDVDQEDFGILQECYSGSDIPYEPGCEYADLHPPENPDGDVDLGDFGVFQTCMNGSNNPPGC